MTTEDKQILLKDLCARLPYKPKVHIEHDIFYDEREPYDTELNLSVLYNRCVGMEIKPYLRPMSSVTKAEKDYFDQSLDLFYAEAYNEDVICATRMIDFFNEHHLDYRGLIEKGLALEAPKDMYNF